MGRAIRHGPWAYPVRMSNRFRGKACVLCGKPSRGVGEHVWPSWFIKEFHGQGPFTSSKSGTPFTKRDGETPATFTALPGIHVPMCENCNSVLDRTIEKPAKDLIRQLIPWTDPHTWPSVSAAEAAALAHWLLKVGLLAAHPAAEYDNPLVDRDPGLDRLSQMQPEWLDWLRTGSAPPTDFSVYVTRRGVDADPPFEGERQRIALPRVVLDGRDLHYMSRSFGFRGLNVTIVWHPGWPILHPLVEDGRAIALWPNPSAVDFASLREVNPREFQFHDLNLGEMQVTAQRFQLMTQDPLSVKSDPFLAIFGDPPPWG